MSNHSGSYQANEMFHKMLSIELFNKISKEDSLVLLRELANVDDGNIGEIYQNIPVSLKYCIDCENFVEEVKSYDGFTLCAECAEADGYTD